MPNDDPTSMIVVGRLVSTAMLCLTAIIIAFIIAAAFG